jgi:hypothetical protein
VEAEAALELPEGQKKRPMAPQKKQENCPPDEYSRNRLRVP